MSIRDDVKAALRISSTVTAYDTEVDDLIAAAEADLELAGVLSAKILDTDPLIKRALICYCKANFGWANEDAERLARSYDMLKAHLSSAADYTRYTVTFTLTASSVPVAGATVTLNGYSLITGATGSVVFAMRPENGLEYAVTCDGYSEVSGTVDVDADEAVAVSLE